MYTEFLESRMKKSKEKNKIPSSSCNYHIYYLRVNKVPEVRNNSNAITSQHLVGRNPAICKHTLVKIQLRDMSPFEFNQKCKGTADLAFASGNSFRYEMKFADRKSPR